MTRRHDDDDEDPEGASERADLESTLAFVAHELRNPLHGMMLHVSLARTMAETQGQAELAGRLARLQTSMSRYAQRVTMLLDLTSPGSGQIQVRPTRVDLDALLRGVVEATLPEARARGVSLSLETPGECVQVLDSQLLEQIVENLLFNAFKHAQCSHIRLSLQRQPGGVRLEVTDNGRGIATEDQKTVFGKFVIGKNDRRAEGKGLGLWIVRRLAQLMGGDVRLTSAAGAGATFTIALPCAADEER
jgi:signal transduction histidine kinase